MKKICFYVILSVIMIACSDQQKEDKIINLPHKSKILCPDCVLIADTITYNMEIKNPDPDDIYVTDYLKQVKRNELLDIIILQIIEGKIKAYDFFNGSVIEPSKVKEIIESGSFPKEQFAQIQFTEKWFYNPKTHEFNKIVYSIVLGFELYDNENKVKGYKPMFKVYLNQ